jgi:hypothetical protein
MIERRICDQTHRLGGEPGSPDEAAAIGEVSAKAIRVMSDAGSTGFVSELSRGQADLWSLPGSKVVNVFDLQHVNSASPAAEPLGLPAKQDRKPNSQTVNESLRSRAARGTFCRPLGKTFEQRLCSQCEPEEGITITLIL